MALNARSLPEPTLNFSESLDVLEEKEEVLTDDDLRKIYEDGEIRRFLHVFSSYVSEVKAMDTPAVSAPPAPWLGKDPNPEGSLSQFIAENFIEPYLPANKRVPPTFTLGKVRLTTQRLYLVCQTTYIPFWKSCCDLARWKNFKRSLAYCTLYWILWWHNMILPGLILWPVLISLGCKLQPYPRGHRLHDYQEQIVRADDFSNRVSETISSSSSLDMKELWRLAKLANQTRKSRTLSKGKKPIPEVAPTPIDPGGSIPETLEPAEEQELRDIKAVALDWMTSAADFHERVQNIFVWQSPAASFRYNMGLLGMFCVVTFIPTRYLAKLFWFFMGVLFWHVVPILDALPHEACSRLPPLLADVPTDAEYAMELISQRVAAGQDVLPAASPSKFHIRGRTEEVKPEKAFYSKSIGEIGKLMSDEATRITRAAMDVREGRPISVGLHPLVSNALSIAIPEANPDVYTYMCQFGSTPGLVTLTLKRLYITPMFSGTSKEDISVEDISGVKKAGFLKGLRISWMKIQDGEPQEQEFKFSWVANRDDLFARLVGLGKQRWKSV